MLLLTVYDKEIIVMFLPQTLAIIEQCKSLISIKYIKPFKKENFVHLTSFGDTPTQVQWTIIEGKDQLLVILQITISFKRSNVVYTTLTHDSPKEAYNEINEHLTIDKVIQNCKQIVPK